jgi:ketosteroid isomerase-like protein
MTMRFMRTMLLSVAMAAMAVGAQAKALKPAAVEGWLQKYGAAWIARDASAAGPLFTSDAIYHENAFEAPMQGRAAIEAYWGKVTADQRDVKFESKLVSVTGNTGVATWKASFKLQSTGATIALDGIFVLEFDEQGVCSSLREWWFVKAGQ